MAKPFSDSPSRLLSEITNFVLGGVSPLTSKPVNNVRSPCTESKLETSLLRVRAALSDLSESSRDMCTENEPRNFEVRKVSSNPFRAPRRALGDDLEALAHNCSGVIGPIFFALVEFKRQRVRLYRSTFPIRPSQYLVVGGDRGEDLGLCVWVWTFNPPESRTLPLFEIPSAGRNLLEFDYDGLACDVRRIASASEVHVQNQVLPALEIDALNVCREKCASMAIGIDVLDVEYQFDRKKITFYFVAEGVVDFRLLVRELWNHFNTRIWLERIPKVAKNIPPTS